MVKLGAEDLTKVRCKKEYGDWYYDKVKPSCWNDYDATVYRLYDADMNLKDEFGSYGDMKYFIETGEYL